MNAMELTIKQDNYYLGEIIKWACLLMFLVLCVIGINTFYQGHVQKSMADTVLLNQKSSLIIQMHKEMLSISRTQLQILHASSEQEVRENLWLLSELVSDHLVHFHQLKNIADEFDTELLMRFRIGFEQWYDFNEDLLVYANAVSDSGFLKTLNKIDMAFSQFDRDASKTLLLITQLK